MYAKQVLPSIEPFVKQLFTILYSSIPFLRESDISPTALRDNILGGMQRESSGTVAVEALQELFTDDGQPKKGPRTQNEATQEQQTIQNLRDTLRTILRVHFVGDPTRFLAQTTNNQVNKMHLKGDRNTQLTLRWEDAFLSKAHNEMNNMN
ncbi:hypothetical protein GQ457_17G015370 [Hibiscus cannabinus]